MIVVWACLIDPSIGRVNKFSFSQQALMEMFVDGIENREIICGSQENPKDIEEWDEVTVNDKKEVTNVNWLSYKLHGSIYLEWLPSTLRALILWENSLTGTIDLCHLPEILELLDVSFNSLSGSIDLENLPDSLVELYFEHNRFTGTISLKSLPEKMRVLTVHNNQFTGSIDVTSLPASMKSLSLNNNKFECETDFSKLPETLDILNVSNTKLSGEINDFKGTYLEVFGSNVKDMKKKSKPKYERRRKT